MSSKSTRSARSSKSTRSARSSRSSRSARSLMSSWSSRSARLKSEIFYMEINQTIIKRVCVGGG